MMEEQNQYSYETPKKMKKIQRNNDSTNITKGYSNSIKNATQQNRKRRSIFAQSNKEIESNSLQNIFNLFHGSFDEQEISEFQVYNSNFCGCEDPYDTCYLLRQRFLQNSGVLKEMRSQYNRILQQIQTPTTKNPHPHRKINLFRSIPSNYPEIYLSQLNNLTNIIKRSLNIAEFQCLCWLQYHAKWQYFTYFLFCDLKKSFNNYQRFRVKLDEIVSVHEGVSLYQLKQETKQKGYGESSFENYVKQYYQSVGAKLIPMTAYAKFIKLIGYNSHQTLLNLLKNFLCFHKKQFMEGLKLLNEGNNEGYRKYLSSLNWQIFLNQIDPEN